jgi:hypothetical protein
VTTFCTASRARLRRARQGQARPMSGARTAEVTRRIASSSGTRQARAGAGDAPTPGRHPAAPYGRKPTGRGAASGRLPPHPQAAGTRSNAPPVTAAARPDRAALPAPGILSPWKDHRQERAQGRVACGDGASANLDTDLSTGRSGASRKGRAGLDSASSLAGSSAPVSYRRRGRACA